MNALINWFSQVASITWFNLRTIPERKGAAAATAVGIGGVVAVFVGVLSIADGFARAMTTVGSDELVLVLRSGADSEMTSGLGREETRVIADAPGVARNESGALTSAELFVIINLPKRSTGTDANVPFRGVEQTAFPVRENITIIEGRNFEPGRSEVIVGVGAAHAFAGLDVGRTLSINNTDWDVVGIFEDGGGIAESEIWTDAAVLQPVYRRGDSFQSVLARLSSADEFNTFKDALTADPRVNVKVERQGDFYAQQSTVITTFIRGIGFFIAFLMALGALFGALNTMYSAVSSRVREVATLRSLGFGAIPVVTSVMIESLVLSIVGGSVGALLAYFAFDGYRASTINWQSFSQVAFQFAVTPQLLVSAVVFAALIGLVGGFFPAVRAARMPIAQGLREN